MICAGNSNIQAITDAKVPSEKSSHKSRRIQLAKKKKEKNLNSQIATFARLLLHLIFIGQRGRLVAVLNAMNY